jgi:hypothetical protein
MARQIVTGIASLVLMGTGAFVANRLAATVLSPEHDHPKPDVVAAPAPGITRDQAAAAYRDLVVPVNAEQAAFADRVEAWTDATSSSDASADAVPFANALRDAHAELEQLGRDYGTAPDVFDRGVKAIAAVEADLARIVEVNVAITVDDWSQRYDADLTELTAAANALRAELGLPLTGTAVATTPVAGG